MIKIIFTVELDCFIELSLLEVYHLIKRRGKYLMKIICDVKLDCFIELGQLAIYLGTSIFW